MLEHRRAELEVVRDRGAAGLLLGLALGASLRLAPLLARLRHRRDPVRLAARAVRVGVRALLGVSGGDLAPLRGQAGGDVVGGNRRSGDNGRRRMRRDIGLADLVAVGLRSDARRAA